MTEPHPYPESDGVEPISVAELLARNGTYGAPAVTRRRRRRRGDSDAVSVAELTGELPVIRDDEADATESDERAIQHVSTASDAPAIEDDSTAYRSGAEEMSPDPPEAPVDELAAHEFPEGEFPPDDPSLVETPADLQRDDAESESYEAPLPARGRIASLWQGNLIVLESILAVAFGAGLFIAFDQLWRWNSLVALVLSVLVILGLVAGVRVVRKTEDIASALIAVAVGALITLGPLALTLRSG